MIELILQAIYHKASNKNDINKKNMNDLIDIKR